MHEVDKACPQINYVDKVNPKNIYKGVLTGIERAFSSSMDFPPKSLLDREKSAAAEITFHLQRKKTLDFALSSIGYRRKLYIY